MQPFISLGRGASFNAAELPQGQAEVLAVHAKFLALGKVVLLSTF